MIKSVFPCLCRDVYSVVDDASCCWICMEEGRNAQKVCRCPGVVHEDCLRRWRIAKKGTEEETHCRFCYSEYPSLYGDKDDNIIHIFMNNSIIGSGGLAVKRRDLAEVVSRYYDIDKRESGLYDIICMIKNNGVQAFHGIDDLDSSFMETGLVILKVNRRHSV